MVASLPVAPLLVLVCVGWNTAQGYSIGEITQYLKRVQEKALNEKEAECNELIKNERTKLEGLYCNITWDGISCWPTTRAGEVVVMPCPDYVNGFLHHENVTRECKPDGMWFVKPDTNKSFSDYSNCAPNNNFTRNFNSFNVPETYQLDNLSIMVNTGYGLSFASLLVAVLIMLYFKKLHCPRNTIHLNLFLSFILRALSSFIKSGSFIDGVGFSDIDVQVNEEGVLSFVNSGTHWQCRLFMTVFVYCISASYAWIFIEALYLQALISVSVFTEKKHLRVYMILGWTLPLSFMIPWVVIRATVANKLCWTTYEGDTTWVEWIIHGPILITIVINFIIFINIVRVLFTKLNASPRPETRIFRYRRLARSTLVLIPLFGVYYLVFGIIFVNIKDNRSHSMIIYIYFEMFFNSFQGFFLSLLFCFFNSEVQNEFKKAWRRYTLSRSGSSRWRSTFTSRTKSWKDHRNSESNGVVSRSDRVRPNEEETSLASPTTKFSRSPLTQTTTCDYEGKSTHITADMEEAESTPWLNNNHNACGQQRLNQDDAL